MAIAFNWLPKDIYAMPWDVFQDVLDAVERRNAESKSANG